MWETLLRIWDRTSGGVAGPLVATGTLAPQMPAAIDAQMTSGAAAAAATVPSRIFTLIADMINEPLVAAFSQVLNEYEAAIAGVATGLLFLYLVFIIMAGMWWQIDLRRAWWNFGIALVPWLFLVNAGAINDWMVQGFLFTVPTWLGDTGARALGAGSLETDSGAFGHILSEALLMGVDLWRSLGMTEFGAALLVVCLMGCAILSIAYTWWIWFKAGLWLVVLFAVSPFAVGAAILPATRGLFFRWVDTVWGFVVLKMLAVVFVVVLLAAEGLIVSQFIGSGAVDKVLLLICACCVFVAFFLMAVDIPRIAASIGGGTVMHGRSAPAAFGFAAGYATRAHQGFQRLSKQPKPAAP